MTYTAEKAIILAAGTGSRMAPVTLETPKPLVKIKGVRIIDTLIDALLEAGIEDITIVRGYKKEAFDALLEKYPGLKFIDNPDFEGTNTLSSAYAALDAISDGCYICEAGLIVSNPEVIRKYHSSSDYLGSYVKETTEWSLQEAEGRAVNYRKGGFNCFQCYGISYWTPEDCEQLREGIQAAWEDGNDNAQFEAVPLILDKENYDVKIHECQKGDVTRVDTIHELIALDPSYKHIKWS